jgi:hypothetical protein
VALDRWLQLRFARVLETAAESAVDPEGFRIPLSSLLGIETGELAGARTQDPRLKRAFIKVLHGGALICMESLKLNIHAGFLVIT